MNNQTLDKKLNTGFKKEELVDPDPYTVVSLILTAVGALSGVAGVVINRRITDQEEKQDLQEIHNRVQKNLGTFESQYSDLQRKVDEFVKFSHEEIGEYIDLNEFPLAIGVVSNSFPVYVVEKFYNIRDEIFQSAGKIIENESSIVFDLRQLSIEDEDLLTASHLFREHIRNLANPERPFLEGLARLQRAIEEGRIYSQNLQRQL